MDDKLTPDQVALMERMGAAKRAALDTMPHAAPVEHPQPVHDYGKAGVITKRERFGRIVWARYDEAANRIIYRHATKGIRSRKYSNELFAQLISPRQ